MIRGIGDCGRRGWDERTGELFSYVDLEKRVPAKHPLRLVFIAGDATDANAVRRAAEGVNAIIHAVNPPGYRGWGKVVLPMIDNTIAAAKAVGARIALPGTIYNYGPDAFPDLLEDSPQNAPTEKGRIRVELEKRLEALSNLLQSVVNHQEELIGAVSADFGHRAVVETRFLELFPLIDEVRFIRRNLRRWMQPRNVAANWHFLPSRARIIYQPLGVVGVLGAWNYLFAPARWGECWRREYTGNCWPGGGTPCGQ